MTRPPSIRRFEQLWWAATILWAFGTLLAWHRTEMTLAGDARTAAAARIAQPITAAVVLLATLALWWLAARRGSPAGKWLVVVVAALSGVQALIRLAGLASSTQSLHPVSLVVLLLSAALTIMAAVALFRPDAAEWFGLGEPEELP